MKTFIQTRDIMGPFGPHAGKTEVFRDGGWHFHKWISRNPGRNPIENSQQRNTHGDLIHARGVNKLDFLIKAFRYNPTKFQVLVRNAFPGKQLDELYRQVIKDMRAGTFDYSFDDILEALDDILEAREILNNTTQQER